MRYHRFLLAAAAGIILLFALPSPTWSQSSQDRKEDSVGPNIKVALEKLGIADASDELKTRYAAYFADFKKEVAARASDFAKPCEYTLRLQAADRTRVVLIEVGLSKKGDPKEMISSCQFFSKGKAAADQTPLAEIIKPCLDRVVTYAKCGN